ncbi:MAG: hypothetical protein O2930_04225 [Acidobacteria bacterium]|nr:hypothetical protein [Acidobacteriota bacterium]
MARRFTRDLRTRTLSVTRRCALVLPLVAGVLLVGCESREVERDLRVVDAHTGWYDVGIQADGDNKLVPSISFALENVSDRAIASVQLNAVFRRMGEDTTWGEHFARGIDAEGLAVGASTGSIVLRSTLGYTGPQTLDQMLLNQNFVDATVEIFGKHGRRMWAKMAEFTIDRQLLIEE